MESKKLSWLAFLLLFPLLGHPQAAWADGGQVLAAASSKSAVAPSSGAPGKVAANWDRDLFAIFREGPELNKIAPTMVAPETKKISSLTSKKFAPPRELKLQGIVFSDEEHAAALVDGKIVRLGAIVDGWLVRRITRHGLLLEDPSGGREYTLLAGSTRAMVSSCAVVARPQ